MNSLALLQRHLQAGVLAGDGEIATDDIEATTGADSARRVGVYVYAYRARLTEVLSNDFPGLRALAGDDAFANLCADYIAAHPSTHYNVRWYGGALAPFLRADEEWSKRPALGAMADLEWKLGLSFDAADEVPLAAAALGAVAAADWPGLRLRLHGSLQRATLSCNVHALRRALDHDEALPALEWTSARHWIAWRENVTVHHRCMDDDEAAALDAVAAGAAFAHVCERLCQWHPPDAVALRAAGLLHRWIADQWVVALVTDGPA